MEVYGTYFAPGSDSPKNRQIHITGHIEDRFLWVNDPTSIVQELKEDSSEGLDFNPISSTPLCSL